MCEEICIFGVLRVQQELTCLEATLESSGRQLAGTLCNAMKSLILHTWMYRKSSTGESGHRAAGHDESMASLLHTHSAQGRHSPQTMYQPSPLVHHVLSNVAHSQSHAPCTAEMSVSRWHTALIKGEADDMHQRQNRPAGHS